MPQMVDRRSVPANTVVDNVFSGKEYETLPFDAFVEFGIVAAATGIQATVISGTDVLARAAPVSEANRFPVYPDDFALNDAVGQGEKLIVSINNPTAGAIVVWTVAKITPMASE